jgi:hypothetical protein
MLAELTPRRPARRLGRITDAIHHPDEMLSPGSKCRRDPMHRA